MAVVAVGRTDISVGGGGPTISLISPTAGSFFVVVTVINKS